MRVSSECARVNGPIMLASYVLRRSPRALCVRSYASNATPGAPKVVQEQVTARASSTGGEYKHV